MATFTALGVALLVLAADKVPEPPSGPNPFLVQAKDLYGKLEFEKCLKRVGQAQQWRSNPKELLDIELYAGLCHFNLGQKPDAEERFKTALRIDPAAELPPYTTPRAVELFARVKKSLKPVAPPPEKEKEKPVVEKKDVPDIIESPPEEKEKEKPKVVETKPAKEEKFPDEGANKSDAPVAKKLTPAAKGEEQVITQPGKPSFAAQKAPAIALTGVAAVGLGFGIGFGAATKDLEAKARTAEFESDFFRMKKQAEGNAVAANVSYGVAATAAVVAVVLWVTGN
jgi:tetratricopeptide (TPR) repeat protein